MSNEHERFGPAPTHAPTSPAPAADPPPPRQTDLPAARFYAKRGPGGALRRNRPAYSITGDYDSVDPPGGWRRARGDRHARRPNERRRGRLARAALSRC